MQNAGHPMFDKNPQIRKRSIITLILSVFLFAAGLFISSSPTSVLAQEVIHFPDLQLEAAVRLALNRPTGLLTAEDLSQLETLEASRQNITDLSGIEYAVNLQNLHLSRNKVEKFAELAGLTQLRFLDLSANHIVDISPLQNLTNLEELDLGHNNISHIEALKNLTGLRTLHLESNKIGKLTPLASLRILENLSLSGILHDSYASSLAQLSKLQHLVLTDGRISDLSFLKNLKQLQFLDLRNNRISNLEALKSLTRLEWLILTDNQVEDLTPLGSLRQLQHLDLNNNRVRLITPLVRLRSIKWVELQNNFLELAEETQARRDIDNLTASGVEVITRPQKLPLYRGNGLVTAKAGSGGQLLRTPAGHYFTLLNYNTGWRIKSFTAAHEGGKPLDRLCELGYRTSGTFTWYSISDNNRVNDNEKIFYTLTYRQPGPVQLGLAIQIWPGYADDSARCFYISQVVLENIETGDLYTVELEQDLPLQSNIQASGVGSLQQDYQEKTAPARSELRQILTEALQQRVSSLEVCYSGETLTMPDELEEMLEDILAEDDYLRYSQRSRSIRWSNKPGGDLLLNLCFHYLSTQEEENIVERQVALILQEILTPKMNNHRKTKAVHDYIVANVAYDLNYREHSAYAALVQGRTVCQGYALLLYKMLEKAGIEVRIISGRAGGENHAWNMVNLDGIWYHLDATWDDPDVPGLIRYDFYNRTDAQMSATHTWEQAQYPAASTPYPLESFF